MNLEYLLFDLDNTLYPKSSGMGKEIDHRMTSFVAEHLGISPKDAKAKRIRYRDNYGTTLQGLVRDDAFDDPEEFFNKVHPTDIYRYIEKDPRLREMLLNIKIPKSILTNSPEEHAKRILKYLEIDTCFENIFDIRFNNLEGKPAIELYKKVLKTIDKKPENVLFIDDLELYLRPFKEIGGNVLLVSENAAGKDLNGIPVINNIKQLSEYLETYLKNAFNL
ncbi:MAG: pyrimidine 5'-nucleotidase [Spirochaetes bacterium]|nr:MAG: pyrimidine 5'-nucleotidase [Spirochaetota bacterium]